MSNPNRALQIAAKELHVRLIGEIKYGWEQKTVGSTVVSADGARGWLRIQMRAKTEETSRLWTGIKESEYIGGILKPAVIRDMEWEYDGYVWRADLMTYIPHKVCSRTPELREPLALGREWYHELRTSLERLAQCETTRIAVSQEYITRRIHERFGEHVETCISEWTTVHSDVHWANLTQPECWILDWEGWGKGPYSFDAAFLYCYSLLEEKNAEKIHSLFSDWLDTHDGYISQLFACTELMNMTEKEGSHPDLYPFLSEKAKELLCHIYIDPV